MRKVRQTVGWLKTETDGFQTVTGLFDHKH